METTGTRNSTSLTASGATTLLKQAQQRVHLALSLANTQALEAYFYSQKGEGDEHGYMLSEYHKGDTLVAQGKLHSTQITILPEFSYAEVPLGYIVEGEVIVIKGGKATKKLEAGDFIGLFETSDWLQTQKKRNIGDWTLMADKETKVLYFGVSALGSKGKATQQLKSYLVESARANQVPQPITSLPLLDWAASHTTIGRLPEFAIVAHTHLLPNNLPFFRHLAYLVGFGRMFVLEKPYSTVRNVYQNLIKSGCEVVQVHMEPGLTYEYAVQKSTEVLWTKVIEEQKKTGFQKLLIVDDGGDLWLSLPWHALKGVAAVGVEQTQRGITRLTNSQQRIPPIVSVAGSGTKKIVESQFIGQSIVEKLQALNLLPTKQVGVMGMGSIGTAVVQSLKKLGVAPLHYDPSYHKDIPNDRAARPSIDAMFNDAELIIGTTGTDALKGVALERIHGHKILVSASSADIEFSTLLKMAEPTTAPFAARSVRVHAELTLDILNGGYPINFDREKDATPDADIVLTRSLMYVGAMQAVRMVEGTKMKGGLYPLDVLSQEKILTRWIEDKLASGAKPSITTNDISSIIGPLHKNGHSTSAPLWID